MANSSMAQFHDVALVKLLAFPLHVTLVKGVTTSTSYEYELLVSENKVQLTRIRDENGKFRSNSVSILNITFA